jgi:hypothetical protein
MNPARLSLRKREQDKFTKGYCTEFAIALHQKNGWPIKVFVELNPPEEGNKEPPEERGFSLIHACCQAPNGLLIDARRPRPEKEIFKNLLLCDLRSAKDFPDLVELRSMSQEELEANFGIEEAALDLANKLLN